jgi:hypothetical protein
MMMETSIFLKSGRSGVSKNLVGVMSHPKIEWLMGKESNLDLQGQNLLSYR